MDRGGPLFLMIFLSIRYFDEMELASLPPVPDWLGPQEQAEASRLKVLKRRREYLSARLAVKELLREHLPAARALDLCQIEVWKEPSGRPFAVLKGDHRLPGRLSISHSHGWVFAGYAEPDIPFGVDAEQVEKRVDAFTGDYFTPAEQAVFDAQTPDQRDVYITLAWSAKEAYLKALGIGLGIDPRSLQVDFFPANGGIWQPLRVSGLRPGLPVYSGLWAQHGAMVFTVCGQDIPLSAIQACTPADEPAI